ncbi:MAG: serine hydrolase [Pseudomonadota bacterium]
MSEEVQVEMRQGKRYNAENVWHWPEVSPAELGLNTDVLDEAASVAEANKSHSLLVIHQGKLALERYWHDKTAKDVQQTYSGTKSIFSLLVGRAIEKGYLKSFEQAVRDFIPEMPEAQSQLTFRNVLAMESGMEYAPEFEALGQTSNMKQLEIGLARKIVAKPYETYYYNNAAYRMLFTALERASDMSLEDLTNQEIYIPLGFEGAFWVLLYAKKGGEESFTGYQSIRLTPRDFAKSAQVILDKGMWNGERYLPESYTEDLIKAPAPDANPSFGLFHHLNGGGYIRNFAVPKQLNRKLVPDGPLDTFMMFGAMGQVVAGIPSKDLVIVRTGRGAESIYERDNYIAKLIKVISDAV